MELTQILIIVGVIGGIILAIIAIRGSFRNDDAFYGESPTVPTHGSGEATPPPAPIEGGGAGSGGGGDGTPDGGGSDGGD